MKTVDRIKLTTSYKGTSDTIADKGFAFFESNQIDYYFKYPKLPKWVRKIVEDANDGSISVLPYFMPSFEFEGHHTIDNYSGQDKYTANNIKLDAKYNKAISLVIPNDNRTIDIIIPGIDGAIHGPWKKDDLELGYYSIIVYQCLKRGRRSEDDYWVKINNRLTNFSENDFENIHEISNSHKFIESFNIWDLSTLIKDGKIDDEVLNRFSEIYKDVVELGEKANTDLLTIGFSKNVEDFLANNENLNINEIIRIKNLVGIEISDNDITDVFYDEINQLNPIVIDIESDGENIFELGIVTVDDAKSYTTKGTIKNALKKLNKLNGMLVGHNIIDWDIPILEKWGMDISNFCFWDTLLIQALLTPINKSIALNGTHKAVEDALVNKDLFYNQALSLLFSKDLREICNCNEIKKATNLLYTTLDERLNTFGFTEDEMNQKKSDYYLKNTSKYLRQKSYHTSEKLLDGISDLTINSRSLIVAPRIIWDDLTRLPNTHFYSLDKTDDYSLIINPKSLNKKGTSKENKLLQAFISYTNQQNLIPRVNNVSGWTRIQVDKSKKPIISYSKEFELEDLEDDQNLCISLNDLLAISSSEEFKQHNFKNIISCLPDLELSTGKMKLGIVEIELAQHFINENHIWRFFSPSNSLFKIDSIEMRDIVFEFFEIDKTFGQNYDRIWLEKTIYGDLILWGKQTQVSKTLVELFKGSEHKVIQDHFVKDTSKSALYFINTEADPKHKGNRQYQRLNPETRYRDFYWLGQILIIEKLSSSSNSIIFIQQESEIKKVKNLFKSRSFDVIDTGHELSDLKMLGQKASPPKVGIFVFSAIDRILEHLPDTSIDIIIDSLPLQEQWIMGGKSLGLLKDDLDENPTEDNSTFDVDQSTELLQDGQIITTTTDDDNIGDELILKYDMVSALLLLYPRIKYYLNRVSNIQNNNRLIILDPRLQKLKSSPKKPLLSKINIVLKLTENAYENALNDVRTWFKSINMETEIQQSKGWVKTLESVFLSGKGVNGDVGTFRKDQMALLNYVFSKEGDALISLPTGGGKSVIFQGPAMYYGLRTGRLTLVISPLKALMRDQIESLWGIGFWNSVEYLSGDLSRIEVNDIYRRVSGGEVTMLFVAPERFRSNQFLKSLGFRVEVDQDSEYWVFDEAHCISQWGLDFRPDYFYAAKKIKEFKKSFSKAPILFVSATVTNQVYNDIEDIFD